MRRQGDDYLRTSPHDQACHTPLAWGFRRTELVSPVRTPCSPLRSTREERLPHRHRSFPRLVSHEIRSPERNGQNHHIIAHEIAWSGAIRNSCRGLRVQCGGSHLGCGDLIAQGLIFPFVLCPVITHLALCPAVRFLERFSVAIRLLQGSSLILTLDNGDIVYNRSCGTESVKAESRGWKCGRNKTQG